jgi:hypothetical protein
VVRDEHGTKDSTPVGVLTVEGSLDERGSRNGSGDLLGILVRGSALFGRKTAKVQHRDLDLVRELKSVP